MIPLLTFLVKLISTAILAALTVPIGIVSLLLWNFDIVIDHMASMEDVWLNK